MNYTRQSVKLSRLALAVLLLKRSRISRVFSYFGIGYHRTDFCPIALAYGITAQTTWWGLTYNDRAILKTSGWDENIYNDFIGWYDGLRYTANPEECYRALRGLIYP